MTTFYHPFDPGRPAPSHRWPFVYLHGEAEELNEEVARTAGWEWAAPDLFEADEPMPAEPGVYRATLYGMPLDVFVADRGLAGYLCGRAAEADPALASWRHAASPEDWM